MGALVAIAACGDSTAPSRTSPPAPASLNGTWIGQMGTPGSGSAVRVTWTAIQAFTAVTGPATLVKPALGVEVTGSMAGTLEGSRVNLSFASGPGSIPPVSTCATLGVGIGTITGSTITGTFSLTVNNCSALDPLTNASLTMTRQ
jgi:hypothetical protein